MKDNPLVYFLGILDTIEPTKKIQGYDPRKVWSGNDVEYNSVRNFISCTILNDEFVDKGWFEKIESLELWLELEVRIINSRELQIIL